jgi:predicted nucleic acid-binding protein
MILTDLANGESVFLDANILVYHFTPHPQYGQACHDLIQRVENQASLGYTSTAVLSELAHHLMTFEASAVFGWTSKVVQHLRHSPSAVMQLSKFHQSASSFGAPAEGAETCRPKEPTVWDASAWSSRLPTMQT